MREAAGERVALALQRVARAVALLQQALGLLRARRRSRGERPNLTLPSDPANAEQAG